MTKHGPDWTIRTAYTQYILWTMVHVLGKKFPFLGPGDLVSSQDAHLITGTIPCPKPNKLGRRISNPKYESLVLNCISLHVGLVFSVMDPTSKFLGLGKGTVSMHSTFSLLNENVQDTTRHLHVCHVRRKNSIVVSSLVHTAWSVVRSGPCFSRRHF